MKHQVILGALLGLLGTLFFAFQTVLVKAFAATLPPLPVVIFIQNSVALACILPFMFSHSFNEGLKAMRTLHPWLQTLRAIFSLSLGFLLYHAVQRIPLVDAVLLANTTPLIVPLIAFLFFSEKITPRFWLPAIIGFIGIIIVLRPGIQIVNTASLFALGAAVCSATALVLVRHAKYDSPNTSSFYFFLLSAVISGVIAAFYWKSFTQNSAKIMISIGICFFLSQYFITCALKLANARLVGLLLYTNIAFSAILAAVIWHEYPAIYTYIGIALIVMSGIFCIRVESVSE